MTRLDGPIVVGVDGATQTLTSVAAAIDLGAWEATRHHVGLHLVYGYGTLTSGADVNADTTRKEAAGQILEHIVARTAASHPQLAVTCVLHAGSAANVLVAASTTASLVIVCADARVHYGGLQAGLVSVQVAAHALAPVIVVAAPRVQPPSNGRALVVVGIDGSADSLDAVAFAFEEAHARDARIHVVYASDRPTGQGPVPEDVLHQATDEWRHKYPDVAVRLDAVTGDNPVRALNDAGTDADLIVAGARGDGGFATLLLGSVSDGLVRYSRTNVAIVHAGW